MKSKIEKIVQSKEWKDGIFFYNLELENGDKINIGKKSILAIGEEIEYEIQPDQENFEYKKAKTPKKERPVFGVAKGNNNSFAVSYAKDIIVARIQAGKTVDVREELTELSKHMKHLIDTI